MYRTTVSIGEGVKVDGEATIYYSSSKETGEIVMHVECADHVVITPVKKLKVRNTDRKQQVPIDSSAH